MTSETSQRRSRLGREIALILAIKAIVLLAVYFALFGPGRRPDIDAEAMERMLFDAAPATLERSDGNV